jgi:hypothetical protein
VTSRTSFVTYTAISRRHKCVSVRRRRDQLLRRKQRAGIRVTSDGRIAERVLKIHSFGRCERRGPNDLPSNVITL